MKYLYETLSQATLLDSNRFYRPENREFAPLEPRRSNPLDRYQLPETQWQIPSSKSVLSDYHTPGVQNVYNQSHHENREQNNNKQHDSHVYGNILNDDEPAEQYLQVDPRCYVRQKPNISLTTYKKSETPRLEKGHSINVDTRPPPSPSSLSPYRQSSFDVTVAHQLSPTPSPAISTQQEIFFTPRGSSLSVIGNISPSTPASSQHLSPPISFTSRQNSITDKKDLAVALDSSGRESSTRSSVVHREHEHSHSLEHSSPTNNSTVDKQSHSFDAVHLLRPDTHREDAILNRRTKSYECADEHPPPSPSPPIAPPPIIIKIPDMRELVQAAQLSRLQKNKSNGYQSNSNRKSSIRTHQIIINNHRNDQITSDDLWQLRQSFDYDEQQQLDGTSPEDLSPDLFTSTSIDSAGAMAIQQNINPTNHDDDLSKYEYRRKSSSNLLLPPPPEVRRQALRRTFEKRRRGINQSNTRREEQQQQLSTGLDDDYDQNNQSSTNKSTEFSSLLNNFNSKSENSSFDRSLETDFDMQSDTSSREPNDHFTSIESSCNENILPNIAQQNQSSHQDDSGYKSLESQNHTFSLDWISADGVESVIYIDKSSKQQEDSNQQQLDNRNQLNPNLHQSYQETSSINNKPIVLKANSVPNKLITSSSFNRTASKKRREFGKDKRHAASNMGIRTDEYQYPSPTIHEVNETNTKRTSSSTLKVRQADFRRSKSDETEILDSSSHSNESPKPPTYSSSSADTVLYSKPSSHPIRLNNPGHIFQRSPSSNTPPVAISPQIIAFRSKRGSISFDNPASSRNSSTLSTGVTKPRLKFSMVRDTTTPSLGSNSPTYSMPLANDLTVDEKTNRIINEFLMRDNIPQQESSKNLHQRIRQNTFDETIKQTALIKQRQHIFIQPTKRQQTPSFHFANSNIYKDVKNNFESPSLTFNQQSETVVVRRDNGIAVSSPSIIVTGYDSGS